MKKYHNVQCIKYASTAEATRAGELKLLAKAGKITDLLEKFSFLLIPAGGGFRGISFVADFAYRDSTGALVVEDVKGVKGVSTAVNIIKQKLMWNIHKIKVVEIRR